MKFFVFIILLIIPTICSGLIINIPVDFASIQAGIDAAVVGDTVLVQPETYFENINFSGKNITIASLFLTTQDDQYISQTIINGSNSGSVVTFSSGEDHAALLIGFTVTNGNGSDNIGGGIHCSDYSSPTLENLIIESNSSITGGGIFCWQSSAIIRNCLIQNNSATYGGGFHAKFCSPNSIPTL